MHLGARQYGLEERYEDFLDAFRKAADGIAEAGVDAAVIGGDLFESPRPDARSVFVAQEAVARIRSAGIPVYGIDGNHDLADGYWLRTVGARPLDVPAEVGGVRIIGAHYRRGRDFVDELRRLADEGERADILTAHFALAEMNGGGSADTGVQELSPILDRLGVKCVMMGHVHIPDHRRWNGVLYMNPGSTEMKSSNEPEEKFFFVLDTDSMEVEERRIETRRVLQDEVSSDGDIAALSERLMEEARKASGGGGGKRPFHHIFADDSVEDAFKRVAKCVHDSYAVARIVMRSCRARDLAPVVDRGEGVATLEGAIEARFPKGSEEARLTARLLHSPDPASIHLIVEKFMTAGRGSRQSGNQE